MSLDFGAARLTPFQHQREDVEALLRRPYLFIASEMRTGKTKIVIDGAQFLFEANKIDRVIVIAPAPVRDVWADQELGELAKHLWLRTPTIVIEFHTYGREWLSGMEHAKDRALQFIVTNYEFLLQERRVKELLKFCDDRTLLVMDESSYIKGWKSGRTEACKRLRRMCGRVVLLNGTPIFHSPLDLFAQGNILHPSILQCRFITEFRSRYAVMEPVKAKDGKSLKNDQGYIIEKVNKWVNLDDLQRRFAPYTIRRMQKDCLDLPPKLDPVALTVPLTAASWKHYQDMRDELIVWLSGGASMSATAAIKVLRLSQITSGFLSGVQTIEEDPADESLFDNLVLDGVQAPTTEAPKPEAPPSSIQFFGREKLDLLLWFLRERLDADPKFKVVVWCRFKAELARMIEEVASAFPEFVIGQVHGGQRKTERIEALKLLHPNTSPDQPVFVGGTFGTGSFGLNMTAAHTSVTLSTDYSPGKFAQSADRVYGPGQKEPIAYFDIVATGPKGQKTIDHAIVAARRAGENIATWTASAWIKALRKE